MCLWCKRGNQKAKTTVRHFMYGRRMRMKNCVIVWKNLLALIIAKLLRNIICNDFYPLTVLCVAFYSKLWFIKALNLNFITLIIKKINLSLIIFLALIMKVNTLRFLFSNHGCLQCKYQLNVLLKIIWNV